MNARQSRRSPPRDRVERRTTTLRPIRRTDSSDRFVRATLVFAGEPGIPWVSAIENRNGGASRLERRAAREPTSREPELQMRARGIAGGVRRSGAWDGPFVRRERGVVLLRRREIWIHNKRSGESPTAGYRVTRALRDQLAHALDAGLQDLRRILLPQLLIEELEAHCRVVAAATEEVELGA